MTTPTHTDTHGLVPHACKLVQLQVLLWAWSQQWQDAKDAMPGSLLLAEKVQSRRENGSTGVREVKRDAPARE